MRLFLPVLGLLAVAGIVAKGNRLTNADVVLFDDTLATATVFDAQIELAELKNVLTEELMEMKERLTTLESSSKESRDHVVTRRHGRLEAGVFEVGFMATLTKDIYIQHNQKIPFDKVITNIGNAFCSNGIFTAPVSGMYLFNFNIMGSRKKTVVQASLMVNGNAIVKAISDRRSSVYTWDMGTTNAIVRLQTLDTVTVQAWRPSGCLGFHGNSYTTFSGYLLHGSQ